VEKQCVGSAFDETDVKSVRVYLMLPLEHYPVIDLGPLERASCGTGLVIGGQGIFHVFLAQFAIGGGMLLCYLQWLHMRGGCRLARRFSVSGCSSTGRRRCCSSRSRSSPRPGANSCGKEFASRSRSGVEARP
jgi:hypothetical protein